MKPSLASQPGMRTLYVLWLAAVVGLLFGDRNTGYLAIATGGFSFLVILIGKWSLPQGDDEPADALKQTGSWPSLSVRGLILLATLAWSFLLGISLSVELPYATHLLENVAAWPSWFPQGGLAPFVALTLLVTPAILLLVSGAKARDLGLVLSSGGRLRLLLWIAAPVTVGIWRVLGGYISLWNVLLLFIENALLNGFQEEFLFRGAILSYLRGLMPTHWAFLAQAVLFSLSHIGVTISTEHGNGWLIVANVLGLNLPFAVLFGLMALRSRSIAMSGTIHFAMDAMGRLLSLHVR